MPSFEDVWHTQPDIHDTDHAESLLDQFGECADQPYEHLYYGPVVGSSIPRVSDLYNTATARSNKRSFRLEGVPQPKFIYKATTTTEAIANLRDPSIRPETLSATSSRDAPEVPESDPPEQQGQRVSKREMADLVKSGRIYQGYPITGQPHRDRPGRRLSNPKAADVDEEANRRAPAVPRPEQARPPDSTASVQSIDNSTILEITRIADGLICIRERHRTKPHSRGHRHPALLLEQKVPGSWPDSEKDDFHITRRAGGECIHDARAQMIQQAQFGFHLYPTVSTIWAVGMAGHWAKFFAFTRNAVPEIDLATAANGRYPNEEFVARVMKDIWASDVFEYIDAEGYYVDTFKKLCHLAIATAAEQYDDQEPRSAEDVKACHNRLYEGLFGAQKRELGLSSVAVPGHGRRTKPV